MFLLFLAYYSYSFHLISYHILPYLTILLLFFLLFPPLCSEAQIFNSTDLHAGVAVVDTTGECSPGVKQSLMTILWQYLTMLQNGSWTQQGLSEGFLKCRKGMESNKDTIWSIWISLRPQASDQHEACALLGNWTDVFCHWETSRFFAAFGISSLLNISHPTSPSKHVVWHWQCPRFAQCGRGTPLGKAARLAIFELRRGKHQFLDFLLILRTSEIS